MLTSAAPPSAAPLAAPSAAPPAAPSAAPPLPAPSTESRACSRFKTSAFHQSTLEDALKRGQLDTSADLSDLRLVQSRKVDSTTMDLVVSDSGRARRSRVKVDKHNDALAALETFKREQAERDKRWLQKQKTRDVHRDKQFAIVRDELADLKLRLLEAEALKRGLLEATRDFATTYSTLVNWHKGNAMWRYEVMTYYDFQCLLHSPSEAEQALQLVKLKAVYQHHSYFPAIDALSTALDPKRPRRNGDAHPSVNSSDLFLVFNAIKKGSSGYTSDVLRSMSDRMRTMHVRIKKDGKWQTVQAFPDASN
ncbi:uncharacterized protein JCM10292_000021 [Rhodotorula paludigena]|uniref:uncharacterized protein n=1 Tax=Rhodotorula paludigena TaxID=86838 RepID=UPI003176D5DB